jgi:hypothetical protein
MALIEAYRELPATRRPGAGRYFFVALAVSYALVAVGGFAPEVFGSVDLAHPLLAYVHGTLMMAWLLVFILQTRFAASGVLKWHRTLGLAAIGLAEVMWISLGIVSFAQLSKFPFFGTLLMQLILMVLFGLFFVWGVLARRDASSHKRLLTLATLVLLQAAVDRMDWLPGLGLPEFWAHAIWLYVLLIPLIVFDVVSIKRIHPITLTGTVAIVVAHTTINLSWTTPGWVNFAREMTNAIR